MAGGHDPAYKIYPFQESLQTIANDRGYYDIESLLNEYAFLEFAKEVGLKIPAFKMDLQDPKLGEKVEADFESGVRSGVNGTPSFFINGSKHDGPFDYATLALAIEEKMVRGHVER